MGLEKVLSCYKKVAGRMSNKYPARSTLEHLSALQKLDEAHTFSIFKKLNSSVKKMEKRNIDCSELRNKIETAHSHFLHQRKNDIHDIQLEIATKKLEQMQKKGNKIGTSAAKSNIRELKHPVIKYAKIFAIASSVGIWANKDSLKESSKTNDNKTLLKQIGLTGLAFGALPIIFKPLKSIINTSTILLGSKLPLTASVLSIAAPLGIGFGVYRVIKNSLCDEIFENNKTEQTQNLNLEQSDNTEPSVNYEC